MGRIAIELVLRDKGSFEREVKRVNDKFGKSVDAINIPDIASISLRSWQGCELVAPYFKSVIPHFRAKYIDPKKPLPFKESLIGNRVSEILLIAGDPPQDPNEPGFYNNSTPDIIKKFRDELPEVKVYAGIDQYRQDMESEIRYIQEKLAAGAQGFFTNPFFDMGFMERYSERLKGLDVFWGICPINSRASQHYWERKNNVVFPKDFVPSNDWSRSFAKESLEFARNKVEVNLYFMPIVVDVEKYLGGILV